MDDAAKTKAQLTPEVTALRHRIGVLEAAEMERQRAEEALQVTKERYTLAVEAGKAGVWDWDLVTDTFYLDPILKALLGFADHEIPNQIETWCQCVHPEDLDWVMAETQAYLARQTPCYEIEHRMLHKDGSIRWFLARGTAFWDATGTPYRMIGTDTDITEHKRMEEALRESEKRYRHLVENSQGLICTHDLDGVLLSINAAAAQGLGYHPDEGIGRNLREFLTPSAQPLFDEYLERIQRQAIDSGLMRLLTKASEERVWVYRNVLYEEAGKPPYVLGHGQDITDLIRAKAELRRLAIALEAVGESIVITDTAGIIQHANPAFERITGYTRQEIIGWNLGSLRSSEPDQAFYRTLWETLTRGEIWRGCFRNRKKDGTLYDTEETITPVCNSSGRVVSYVAVGHDITARKRAEEALRRAERLASIGTLAAGIAHEINNPVGMMLLAAQSALKLREDPDAEAHMEHALHTIISNGKRCGQIVKSVLQFARQEPTDKWPHDFNATIRRAVELTSPYADDHGVRLDLQLAQGLPAVIINPLEMEQVFVNLIRNAIEAGHPGMRVHVWTENASTTVRSIVQDNGRGMTGEEQRYLFDPFYTTRRQQDGMGLGLSIAHSIVEGHGGTIAVQSQRGSGTTITIDLPHVTLGKQGDDP